MRKPKNEPEIKRNLRRFLLTNPLFIYKTTNRKILTRDATRILICCIFDIYDMVYWGYNITTYFIDSYLGDTMTHIEIFSALKYLEELHLIENLSGNPDSYTFTPTHEGMYFFELRHKNFIYLMMNSIFLPVLVAIITTLITLSISGLV